MSSLEVMRFFVISWPQALFCLIAALIVLREDIRKLWRKIFLASFAAGVGSWITFNYIQINEIKFVIDILIFFVCFKVILGVSWFRGVIVVSVFVLLAIYATITGVTMAAVLFDATLPQIQTDISIWLKVLLPAFVSTPLIARAIRPLWGLILSLFSAIKANFPYVRPLVLAIIIQVLLLITFLSQVVKTDDSYIFQSGMIIFLLLFGLNVYILIRSVNITERKLIAQSQSAISDNVMDLINSARSQRHDFANNLQIINSLVHSDNKQALKEYLSQLNENISFYNDMLKINEPIVSALLNAKIAQAELKRVKVRLNICADLSKLSTRAFDITRILGNLIDNAMEAETQYKNEDKWIELAIEEKGPLLVFSITNPGTLPEEIKRKIFAPGFTTKGDNHSGLGLYICEQLAKKLHGKIEFTSSAETGTTFSLVLPKP